MPFSKRATALELSNNLLDLRIDWFEDLSRECDLTFPYRRNVFNAIYSKSATSEAFLEDIATHERYELKTGSVNLVPLRRTVRYRHPEDLSLISIHFSLEFASGFDLFAEAPHVFYGQHPELVHRLVQIARQTENDQIGAMLALRSFILNFCLQCYPELPPPRSAAAMRYGELLAQTAKNIDAGVSVDDLANAMGCTRETFSRNFHRDVGITPTAWLHRVLADRIAARLQDPEITLDKIARQLKFSSEFYLSHFFKRETGASPRLYRQRCQYETTVDPMPHKNTNEF